MFVRGLLAAAALCVAGAANAADISSPGIVDSGIRLSVDMRPNAGNSPAGTPPGVLVFDSRNPSETLTSTTTTPNTFMGYAFNAIDPGGPLQLTGMTVYVVNSTGATINATNLRGNVQFWDTFNASANPIFGTPIGPAPIVFDVGPVVFATGTFLEIDVTFPAPLPAFTGLANHGFAANWQVDTGTGLQSVNNLTTLMRAGAAPIAVGTSPIPGTSYGYRNASARTDFNFLSTDLRGFAALTNQATVFRLFALAPAANADLAITKTDGVTSATPGGSVTYSITASNSGPSNAPGATVADTFPASLTCTWTCTGVGGGTCTAAGSGNINDTVNLPSGASVVYTASCTIAAAATGSLSNTATIAAPAGVTDPTPGNNSATDTDTLLPSANLAITKTDGVTTATPGGSATYTITASNAGPSNATGSTVIDTFPASETCTWTCTGTGGGSCTASSSGNINDTISLPAGGSATYVASCSISAAASGTLSNTATVATPAGVTDPVPGNNSATDTDTLGASADLAITKTDGVTSVTAGGNTTYTITASNAGPSNATGATVADTFPASLTCTWTCAGAGGGTCTASGSGNINDTVNLPSGGSTIHTATCALAVGASGSLSNTATVTAPGGVTDPTPGNNSATDTDTINPALTASVTGTKAVSGTFSPGGAVIYSIVLTNGGTGAQADNAGNEFTDVLPASLVLVAANASSGTAVATVATNTVSWNGAIAAGASVTITISASIPANSTAASISNQGTIATDLDANGTNETQRTTDNPATQTANDPTSFAVVVVNPTGIGGPITPVPTLGAWALALLALLLGGFATVGMRHRA